MKVMSKVLAVVFALLAVMAFYAAAFCNAPWHFATAIASTIIGIVLFTDSQTPDNTSLQ